MAEEPRVKWEHPFPEATVAFAVDVSESTDAETLQAERTFTHKVAVQLGFQSRTTGRLLLRTQDDVISRPVNREPMSPEIDPLGIFDIVSSAGPARPSVLFQDDAARNTLLNSTIWFLMTNGEVEESERMAFEQGFTKSTVHGTTCVTVTFGKTNSMPQNTDLRLSRSVFDLCPNSLILFYDIESHNIMIIRSKGIFNTLLKGIECPTIEPRTIWFEFPRFDYKDLAKVKVPPPFMLAEDEVILEDSFGSFRLADLLANQLDDEMVKTILSNPDNLFAVLKLAQLQSNSEEFRAWAQNDMWDYDDCLWKPRVDIEEQAKIAFLRLSEAITEGRDQDTVDTLKCALREAHASNLEGFHDSCRDVETLRRWIIQAILRSHPHSIIPAGPVEWVASLDAEDSAEGSYPDGVMGWHALLWNPGFAAETETPHLGTCSICGVTNANLNLMFKAPTASTAQPDAYPKYSAGDNVEAEWPWKVGYATENEVLCTSVCCCGPCSTHCLSLGFAGIEDKLTSTWPIGQYLRNEDVYRMQLEQIFGCRVDPALAPVVFLSVLLKARKGVVDSNRDLIQLSGTTVEDTLRKAVSRVIADLIQGIKTKSDGLPPRPSEKDGMPRPPPVQEFAPAYKVAGRHELDDEPILDKIYEGHVVSLQTYGAFVNIHGVREKVDGLLHVSQLGAGYRVNHSNEILEVDQVVMVEVIRIEDDGTKKKIALSMKGVDQEKSPDPAPQPIQPSFAHAEPMDDTRLTLQERLPTAIKAMNGRLNKPGHFLHGFSLPAFTAAFEAACVALGPDAADPAWAANLRVAAMKRYLFRLTEGVWAFGAKDRRRWTLTRNILKNLVESYIELMKTISPATIVGTPLLNRVDWELVCGMRCYKDIEEVLEQATAVFLQELVGMDEKAFSSISDQQWTVETLFTKVFARPQVAKILEEVGGGHVQEEEEEQVEAASVKKDAGWGTQAEETQVWGGGGWGSAAGNAAAEEGHDGWGPAVGNAPVEEGHDDWGPSAVEAPVKDAQDLGLTAEISPVKDA